MAIRISSVNKWIRLAFIQIFSRQILNVEVTFFFLMVSESKYIRISFNCHYWNDINMFANLKSKPTLCVEVSVIRHLGKYRENSVPFFLNLCSSSTGPIPMAVNETGIFRHVRLFISDVSDGPNFPLNICLFSSTRFVSVSVLSALQLGFLEYIHWHCFDFFPSANSRHSLNFLPLPQKSAFVG